MVRCQVVSCGLLRVSNKNVRSTGIWSFSTNSLDSVGPNIATRNSSVWYSWAESREYESPNCYCTLVDLAWTMARPGVVPEPRCPKMGKRHHRGLEQEALSAERRPEEKGTEFGSVIVSTVKGLNRVQISKYRKSFSCS